MSSRIGRRWGYLIAGVIAALTLSACGNSNGSSAGQTSGGGQANFVVGIAEMPPQLVRSFGSDPHAALTGLAIDEGLVRTEKNYTVVPSLATSWESSANFKTWTIHLRENVKWHDGQPFTADDVVFSFEKILPLSPSAGRLGTAVESATATDAKTVSVKLKYAFPQFALALAPQSFTIQPKHIYDNGTDVTKNPNNQAPVGTGPYKFESQTSDTVTLVRNDSYWAGVPPIEKIIFKVIPDSNSRANAMLKGDIDYINKFDVDSTVVKVLSGQKDIALQNGRVAPTFMTMPLNTRSGPLANPKVRQALLMGLDRSLLSKTADPNFTTPALGSFPTTIWAFDKSIDYSKMYAFDPAAANKLLDEAGFPKKSDGTRFSLRFRFVPTQAYVQPMSAVIASEWKDLGIDVQQTQDQLAVWTDAIFAKNDFDVTMYSQTTLIDPEFGISIAFKCNPKNITFNNPTGFCDDSMDAQWVAAASIDDKTKRAADYATIQQTIAEQLPTLRLLQMDQPDAIRTTVKNTAGFLSGVDHGDLTWSVLGS